MKTLLAMCVLVLCGFLAAQEPMNNEGVIKLVKAGVTEELVINLIKQQPGAYTLGAADVVALKDAGVSEKIITAMMAHVSGAAAMPATAPGSPAAAAGAAGPAPGSKGPAPDTGVYYKKNNDYLELLTEDVTWKTKGAMKNIVSAGIVKKDLDGWVQGPSSRNFLTTPLDIIIAPPPGMNVNNYILLKFDASKGGREFTVGPVNQESGVPKGAIPFGVEKVSGSQFRLVFQPALAPGEYGILALMPSTKNTSQTQIYTFRLLL